MELPRANYSTHKRELLSSILLLSGQGHLLGTKSLVPFCDQASTEYFLKGDSRENRKLRRWCSYLAQLRLHIYTVAGLQNELCDCHSRESFNDKTSASSEQFFREAFAKMDGHLESGMSKVALWDSIRCKDYEEQ